MCMATPYVVVSLAVAGATASTTYDTIRYHATTTYIYDHPIRIEAGHVHARGAVRYGVLGFPGGRGGKLAPKPHVTPAIGGRGRAAPCMHAWPSDDQVSRALC